MKTNNFENLILLEFMINKVELYEGGTNIDKNFLNSLGFTRIQVKFRGCKLLEIFEDEGCKRKTDQATGTTTAYLGSGKSCLFSMNQFLSGCDNQARLCVSRKAPPGERKEYFTFGEAIVNMDSLFKGLRKGSTCGSAVKSTRCEADIVDGQCNKVGSLDVFIRGTNLGKNIMTMFQLGTAESSFYFKGTDPTQENEEEDESIYFPDSRAEMSTAFDPRQQPYMRNVPQPSFYGQQRFAAQDPYREGITYNQTVPLSRGPVGPVSGGRGDYSVPFQGAIPAEPGMPPIIQPGIMPISEPGVMPMVGAIPNLPTYAEQPVAAMNPYAQMPLYNYRDEDYEKLDGEYKEISAEVNGYEVKIKLLRRPKKENA